MNKIYPVKMKKHLKALLLSCILFVAAIPAANAGYIAGSGAVACGGNGYYSFYSFDWNYNCYGMSWTMYRPDGTTAYGYGSSFAANVGNVAGTATIYASGWCYNSYGQSIYESGAYYTSVGSGKLPTPGSISGSSHRCNNSTGTYSISAVSGASSYTWQVPSGWKINGSSTTSLTTSSTSVSITTPTSGSGSGTVKVRANGSGCTGPSDFRSRTVRYGAQTPVLYGPSSVSPNAFYDYYTSGVGLSNFVWTVPSGWTVYGSGSSIGVVPSLNSGYVEVRATSCGVTRSDYIYVNSSNNGGCDMLRLPEPCIAPYRASDELPAGVTISVFPNPVATQATVQLAQGQDITTLRVLNQLQQVVFEAKPNTNKTTVDLSKFDNGMYFIQVNGGEGELTQRVLVQH